MSTTRKTTKLSFDPKDYRSLKPLLALEVARCRCPNSVNPEVTTWPITDGAFTGVGSGRPALLEVRDEIDIHLFSENAICSFFLPEKSDERGTDVHAWLEWESSILQPNLAPVVAQTWGGTKASDHSTSKAKSLLRELDTRLTANSFLVGNEISAADISIFVSLYPLSSNEKVKISHLNECSHTVDWLQRLNDLNSFKEVLSKSTMHDYKDSFLSKSAPFLSTTRTEVELPVTKSEDNVQERDLEKGLSDCTIFSEHVNLTSEEIANAQEYFLGGANSMPKHKKRTPPILPIIGERNVLIVSALPYVNNVPHLGNIIGCVLSADVFARYCRLRNYNTLYVCGTDEYGTATETKAIEEGVTPREICDKYFALHSEVYSWFGIEFDHFGRTTTPQQTEIAQEMFWQLHKNGCLLEDSMEQLHCSHCDRFLADRFVEGTCPFCQYTDARGDQCDKCGKLINTVELIAPRCKLCHTTPVKKTSNHLFLNLPKLADRVQAHFERVLQSGCWSPSAKMITRAWLREGLKPRCITRDLKWGVPVPLEGFKDKVFYVWYDAPIGYPSITATYTTAWKSWWKNPDEVQLYNFMAKDNVPFHSVMFPACLIGADDGYTVVNSLSATEYLNYEDGKFSKSRGVGVFGNDARDTGIPADIWRFYLLYIRPETQDSVFSWSDLMTKNNSELLNNLGNFINRALVFVSNFFGGVIPPMELMNADDWTFVAEINREVQSYINLLENIRLRDAIRHILNISRLGNQHIQNHKPWVLIKGSEQDKARAGTVIGLSVNVSCLLSIMLDPYMPTTSQTVRNQLGVAENGQLADAFKILPSGLIRYLEPGHRIGTPVPLFRKIETNEVDGFRRRFAGKQSTRENTPLSNAKAPSTLTPAAATTVANGESNQMLNVQNDDLNLAIANQGDIVRALKQKGANKEDVAFEVAKLLELKKRLASATGEEAIGATKKGKKKSSKLKAV